MHMPDKQRQTVTILYEHDQLPGYDRDSAYAIARQLEDCGYLVRFLGVEVFAALKNVFSYAGYLLIIPSAETMPLELITPLRNYLERGGRALFLGGPLFYDNIRKTEKGYEKLPMPEAPKNSMYIDATFIPGVPRLVIEGVTPSYKNYTVDYDGPLTSSEGQHIWDGELAAAPRRVQCPSARPRGDGYRKDRRHRYIPIADAGEKGAAAFIMLNGLRGQPRMEGYSHAERPGFVKNTCFGGAVGGIGLSAAELMAADGGGELFKAMVGTLLRGVYLFEAGTTEYRVRCGKKVTLGARVLNTTLYFEETSLRFTIRCEGYERVFERDLLAAPYNLTPLEFPLGEELAYGSYTATTELLYKGEVIDSIVQEFAFDAPLCPQPDEFLRVEGEYFMLGGKRWTAKGMNYWPHFYPSFENDDYWCGWLDSSFYSPRDLELDLRRMKSFGINLLLTRIDGYEHSRISDNLRDFLARCRAHGMKVMLAYPNAQAPADYCDAAFRQLVYENGLQNDPTITAWDIAWEIGPHYGGMRQLWRDDWVAWLEDRYGSIEAAEESWGCRIDRTVDGLIRDPGNIFDSDGPERVKAMAYRRFLETLADRHWSYAVRAMRKIDPNHLYTYRQSSLSKLDIAFLGTNRHTDFVCPEGYHIANSEEGYAGACFSTEALRHISGQPVLWAEFGYSPCGKMWTRVYWDHDNRTFLPGEEDYQTEYMGRINRMLIDSHADGAAPWWWCGGFRLAELADFGYMGPDGTPRKCLREYAETLTVLGRDEHPAHDVIITIDPEASPKGIYGACMEEGARLWSKARASGNYPGVVLRGEDYTSDACPNEAVGGGIWTNGCPHRWLEGAIDFVSLSGCSCEYIDGDTVEIETGCRRLILSAQAGNNGAASWTDGVRIVSDFGSLSLPAGSEVRRNGTVTFTGTLEIPEEADRIKLRLETSGGVKFGSSFTLLLEHK